MITLDDAIQKGDDAAFDEAIASGASIRQVNSFGDSPLNRAVSFGRTYMVRRLLEFGADIIQRDSQGYSPSERAAYEGYTDLLHVLIDAGAPLSNRLLHEAATYSGPRDKADTVSYLVGLGCMVNCLDMNGETPLHHAAAANYASTVKTLLAASSAPDAREPSKGWTPLHIAAVCGSEASAEALVQGGADVHACDLKGRTALALAAENDRGEIVGMLAPVSGQAGALIARKYFGRGTDGPTKA